MTRFLKFLMVVIVSIGIGSLLALFIARYLDDASLLRPFAQVLILLIFLTLAYKAGWIEMARITWGDPAKKSNKKLTIHHFVSIIIFGIGLGILMRVGTQGLALSVLKITNSNMYVSESQDLFDLWNYSEIFSFSRALGFLLGATREEVMYRYIILGSMLPAFGVLRSVVYTSVIFSIVHMNPILIISGLVFASVFIVSRSLFLVVIMHTAANTWHLAVAKYRFISDEILRDNVLGSSYGIFMLCSAFLFVLIGIFLTNKIKKFNADYKLQKHVNDETKI